MTRGSAVQPAPVPRAILWHPDQGDAAHPRPAGYVIFMEQNALVAVQEHADATPDEGVLGFLIGDLCRDPHSNLRYLVIDSTVRLTQRVYGDKTAGIVGKLWPRLQDALASGGGTLLGWYHSHPPEGLGLAPGDLETHHRYFDQPYHTALVLARQARGAVAAFFRPGETPRTITTPLPFFELVPEQVMAEEGAKRSRLPWANYVTHARLSGALEAASPGTVPPPRAPAAPRALLEVVGRERPPSPPPPLPHPPPPPTLSVAPRPTHVFGPPLPPGEPPRPAPPAPPARPPTPPSSAPEPRRRPTPRPAPALEIRRPAPRRRRTRRVVVAALILAAAAAGVALWRSGVWRPATRPIGTAEPPRVEQPAAPAMSPAESALARVDVLADTVAVALRNYHERAGLFAAGRMTCAELGRGLVAVDESWIAYNARGKVGAPPLEGARLALDQWLYAGVDSVERHFEGAGCERP